MPGVGQYNCYDEKKMKSNNSPKCTFGYENKKNFVDILNKTFVPGPSDYKIEKSSLNKTLGIFDKTKRKATSTSVCDYNIFTPGPSTYNVEKKPQN